MSTPRYIREYLTAHPDAHRDEVIDRLGYDFEHETVRGPVYDSWGESVMDEHNFAKNSKNCSQASKPRTRKRPTKSPVLA